VTAAPSDSLVLDLEIDFEHPLIGEQHLAWTWAEGGFEAELGWARTFGFERDVAALQRMGLIAGGSLDNALVFSEDGVRNPGGLKAPDEPVRHKAMDMLGDLALLGVPVRGRFSGCRPGHSRVIGLVRALLADPDAWHISIEASGA
jgi:UDP-3-O-[3-hydroxymyristoyl] N-acetylglucosamine deacetylase